MFAALLCAACTAGFFTFSTLSLFLNRGYAHFKLTADMVEAAHSCRQTAFLFGFVAILAALPSVTRWCNMQRRRMRAWRKHVLPGAYRR